ncbi:MULTISPECIES: HP0268 family nuclease [unclassified Helicobacter]|uniref:HP0268 family nuclease n=1 Tax=unclassified Helicobacter TaxID=2593540 RepID=UPI000CF036EC|nr:MULTISPECIES: HP0268 family nuclease [unclassified Helicobacter]
MELKLALTSKNSKEQVITLDDMLEQAIGEKFFYLDKENKEKDLQKVIKTFASKRRSAKLNKVFFGLDEKDFIFELHII